MGGVTRLRLDARGNLLLQMPAGTVRQQRPIAYQQIGGRRRVVPASYILDGSHTVGFALARYDTRRPLVIDPVLGYSTYLGGTGDDGGIGIAVDAHGSAYVTGVPARIISLVNAAQLRNAAEPGSLRRLRGQAKPRRHRAGLLHLPGRLRRTMARRLSPSTAPATPTSRAYDSSDFPSSTLCRCATAALLTLAMPLSPNSTSGNALLYSTYFGGRANDGGNGIAVDSAGDAYVTGYTQSKDFPTRDALQPSCGGCDPSANSGDAFVTKLSPAGNVLLFSTYLGGSGNDVGNGIAVDPTRNIFVTGATGSIDFPKAAALQGAAGGDSDAFVVRLNPAGSALVYSDLLGGNDSDEGLAIAVDAGA